MVVCPPRSHHHSRAGSCCSRWRINASRSHGECPATGGSIPCEIPDRLVGEIFSSFKLPDDWEDELMKKIEGRDELARIIDERERVKEKLRRLGLAFVDGVYGDLEYRQHKQRLNGQLESLVIPEIDATREAAALLQNVPKLWSRSNLMDRHRLLTVVADAVFLSFKDPARVDLKLKPVFATLRS